MSDDTVYGPFLDEELFSYHDAKTTLMLDSLEMYDTDRGFIGFDDLEAIHEQGRQGSFDNIIFSGIVTLEKTSYLCERGFKSLLKEVEKKDPSMNPEKLRKYCKKEKIKIELQCQLALMPVCYLTKRPANSIIIYSKNENNITGQRRYIVNTFHTTCFRRSELTLRRYMVLKFVVDTCTRYHKDVPREDRDVHWLVKVYVEDYAAVFNKHQRPQLHRSEVYDHFAVHAKWLRKVFARKVLVDRSSWEVWLDEVKRSKKKAKAAGQKWGVPIRRPFLLFERRQSQAPSLDNEYIDNVPDVVPDIIPDTDSEESSESEEESSSESDSSDHDEVHYIAHDTSLSSRTYQGLFKPMPLPAWYWTCDIKDGCSFIIDLGSKRSLDAPCMEPLSPKEKDYLRDSVWGLYDVKLGKIWRKMCQAHMDWHWREVGLVLDHNLKRIYGVEEEDQAGKDND